MLLVNHTEFSWSILILSCINWGGYWSMLTFHVGCEWTVRYWDIGYGEPAPFSLSMPFLFMSVDLQDTEIQKHNTLCCSFFQRSNYSYFLLHPASQFPSQGAALVSLNHPSDLCLRACMGNLLLLSAMSYTLKNDSPTQRVETFLSIA